MNTPERPVTDRQIVMIFVSCVGLVLVLAWGGIALMHHGLFGAGGRVELIVTNQAASQVDVSMIEYTQHTPLVRLDGVTPGTTASTAEHIGFVGSYVLRVRVGAKAYEEAQGGPLIDDNGPHRFRLDVRNDGVAVTHRSNNGESTYELR